MYQTVSPSCRRCCRVAEVVFYKGRHTCYCLCFGLVYVHDPCIRFKFATYHFAGGGILSYHGFYRFRLE